MESRKDKLRETRSKVVARGRGDGANGEMLLKVYTLPVIKINKFGDLMYIMLFIAYNILYT